MAYIVAAAGPAAIFVLKRGCYFCALFKESLKAVEELSFQYLSSLVDQRNNIRINSHSLNTTL